MRRILTWGLLCSVVFVLNVAPGFGGQEPKQVVHERYTGKFVQAPGGVNLLSKGMAETRQATYVYLYETVNVAIQEYTSSQEVRDLAKTFQNGGDDALQKALSKRKNGHFQIGQGPSMSVLYATSSSQGKSRILSIIGKAPPWFSKPSIALTTEESGTTRVTAVAHAYTFIELRIDENGNGNGQVVLFAFLVFDQQGQAIVKPIRMEAGSQVFQLGDVHSEK
jgi:hypothetical protein